MQFPLMVRCRCFFPLWMEDPGIPGQYELSFHEDTNEIYMTICSGREEELSQNINYLLDCSMKPGCWKSVFRTGWSFPSKEQALKYGEQAEVSVFLKAEAIFLLFDGSKEKILPQQTELYQFSYLKEKTYDRLGPPLSPEDIDHW